MSGPHSSVPSLVEIEALAYRYPKGRLNALDGITALIPEGKIVGLVGPDGAGKTTLIRLMTGLLVPTKGKITVAGYDTVKEAVKIHALIGYMPQKFGLYEDLTVDQNLKLYADLRGVVGEERREAFDRLLRFTQLGPFRDRLARALSGGMKQKLGLACALIAKPKLLLLDEPSVGVDPISRRELWRLVQDLLAGGVTAVWSTAYLDEAERCDLVLLLSEGKLLYQGEPTALTERVHGRVFAVSGLQKSRRAILAKILDQPGVIDGVIEGSDLRIVTDQTGRKPDLTDEPEATLRPLNPRFEDAFIDILGGGPGGRSPLAETLPPLAREEESKPVVEAKNLTKKFGSFTAVENVSFQVKRGEIFGLLGPNGAGKSTTFRMMCGLLKPTSGQAFIEGRDLGQAPGKVRAHVGYMAQKFSLFGNLSVEQNLIFFSGVYNLPFRRRRATIRQMIEIFNFEEFLTESADRLPLGFKQRLALSCAVMHHPDVLFLDEPTSGVDPYTRREFWNAINGFVERGVTVVVTTHFMDEAAYCDRVGLVYRSQMILIDTPDALKDRVKSAENPNPTLEDAFVQMIEEYESAHPSR